MRNNKITKALGTAALQEVMTYSETRLESHLTQCFVHCILSSCTGMWCRILSC